MKTRKFALAFLVIILFALSSACNFNSVTNLFATPTATSTNTPLPTLTPTITPTATSTSTSTPPPTPAISWSPGVNYKNDKFGFSMVFPNGTQIDPMELTDASGLPSSWTGLVYSFMIGRAGPVGILGFSSTNRNLLPKSMEDIVTTVAFNLPNGHGQISTSTFSNEHQVEIGRIDDNTGSTAIYFKSKQVLVYFTFIYDIADKQSAEMIISGSVDRIQLK